MLFHKKSLLFCALLSLVIQSIHSMSKKDRRDLQKSVARNAQQDNYFQTQQLKHALKAKKSGPQTTKKANQIQKLKNELQAITQPEQTAQKQIQAITTYVSPLALADAAYQKSPEGILKGQIGQQKAQIKRLTEQLEKKNKELEGQKAAHQFVIQNAQEEQASAAAAFRSATEENDAERARRKKAQEGIWNSLMKQRTLEQKINRLSTELQSAELARQELEQQKQRSEDSALTAELKYSKNLTDFRKTQEHLRRETLKAMERLKALNQADLEQKITRAIKSAEIKAEKYYEEQKNDLITLRDATAKQKKEDFEEKLSAQEKSFQAQIATLKERGQKELEIQKNKTQRAEQTALAAQLLQRQAHEELSIAQDRYNNQLHIKAAEWAKNHPGWATTLGLVSVVGTTAALGGYGKLPTSLQAPFNKGVERATNALPYALELAKTKSFSYAPAPLKGAWSSFTSFVSNAWSKLFNS